ncbi:INSI1 protein, partial [Centropus bengalensis]|nr:INSI1 protein [Centropus bengalensis]
MPRLERSTWSCSGTARERSKTQPAAKVGEMLGNSASSPALTLVGHRAPASSPASTLNWSQHLVQRSVVLFVVGAFMALVLNMLQIQRNVTLFPEEVISTLFSSAWWVPPCCGTAAGDWGGWGAECRLCLGTFTLPPPAMSVNAAVRKDACPLRDFLNIFFQKLDFANNVQLSLTLAALSLGLWWTFDRSRSGLGLGITIAFVATLITQFLVYNGVYQYTSPDFLYIRSWLPCIFFSGGVTVGNIGRQLAMVI